MKHSTLEAPIFPFGITSEEFDENDPWAELKALEGTKEAAAAYKKENGSTRQMVFSPKEDAQ